MSTGFELTPGASHYPVIVSPGPGGRFTAAPAGVPDLHAEGDTPEQAVAGFMQTVNYRRNQDALMQTPPSLPPFAADMQAARDAIAGALAQGRTMLNEPEAKRVFAAYGIPVVPTERAADPDDIDIQRMKQARYHFESVKASIDSVLFAS